MRGALITALLLIAFVGAAFSVRFINNWKIFVCALMITVISIILVILLVKDK